MKVNVDYVIFQTSKKDVRFMDLDMGVTKVDLVKDEYKEVWRDLFSVYLVDEHSLLEELFYIFNVNHPAGYKGRSLSVSDIVKLGDKYYFCSSIGWTEISIA